MRGWELISIVSEYLRLVHMVQLCSYNEAAPPSSTCTCHASSMYSSYQYNQSQTSHHMHIPR